MENKNRMSGRQEQRSLVRQMWRGITGKKAGIFCLVFLSVMMVGLAAAPLSPYDPNAIDVMHKMEGISFRHWFGTDDYGRDYFTRALYGGRVSLTVGIGAMLVTTAFGTAVGIFSGYIGGKTDMLLMRFTDIFMALPSMLLMVVLNTLLRPGMTTLILVLSLFSWPSVARITRAETLSVKNRDYVVAARSIGAGHVRIALRHIFPNIIGPVIVAAANGIAGAILSESSLSYLGLGVQIPQASWGSMVKNAQASILDQPMLTVIPTVLIFLTVLSFHLLGDILRDVLEPKRERQEAR